MSEYKPTRRDLLSNRRHQIEDAAARKAMEPRACVHLALASSDGQVSGLKFRDVRGSDTYLLNLHAALVALFRHEALRLGYHPSNDSDSAMLGPVAGMFAETVPTSGKTAGMFAEAEADAFLCWNCVESDDTNGPRPKDCGLTLNAETVARCDRCGYDPLGVVLETPESYMDRIRDNSEAKDEDEDNGI